jgi:putative addiction module CopG family antidote
MNVTLTPQLEAIVTMRIESGCNTDVEDVIREALQLLCARDEAERLQESLVESEAQIERGESATWSPELMQRLIAEADELKRQGTRAGRDVRP